MRGAPLVGIGMVLLGACEGTTPAGSSGGVEILDSAGVEMVRDARSERVLSLEERLRVGVVEGDPDLQFDQVRGLAVEADGGFWVVDSHASIRRFDARGSFRGRAGGQGEGPGESEGYFTAVATDGGIVVSGQPGRLQRFRRDGAFLQSRAQRTEEGGFLTLLGRTGGRLVFTLMHLPATTDESHTLATGGSTLVRTTTEVLTAPDSLTPLTSVGTFAGRLLTQRGGAGSSLLGDPAFATGGGGRIHVSDTLAYRIETYDLEGGLRRVVERPLPPSAVPDGFGDRVREGVERTFRDGIPGIIGPGLSPQRQDQVERITASAVPPRLPPHLPFVDRIFATSEGVLWVERADRHPRPAMRAVAHAFGFVRWAWHPAWRAPQVFDLFDADGRYRGTVELPFDYVPLAVAGDRVYGSLTDELGVERIIGFEVDEP